MNRSVFLIMGGALLVAIVVAMLVQAKLSPRGSDKAAPTSEILVANRKILTGEVLKPEDARWQGWPDNVMFEGVYSKKDYPDDKTPDVYGIPLRRSLESGEPVTKQALVPDFKGGSNYLAATIAPGMRAVAIPARVESSAGGFLMPGDHVDIILTYTPTISGEVQNYAAPLINRIASETIMTNVKILAVDQNVKEEDRGDAKGALKTVTVEVTQQGAQVLSLITQMGTITMALRRLGEKDTAENTGRPLTTDSTTSDILKKLNKIGAQTKSGSNNVRVYSGTAVTNIPVRSAPPTNSGN
ncbi:MAG: Flp pilus assembly protein CpaB [Alphaproteobacteria bacterium]|nr:MAG: Flp pilus assembly protein CpaB [Alphaproteobacteria bacterium]